MDGSVCKKALQKDQARERKELSDDREEVVEVWEMERKWKEKSFSFFYGEKILSSDDAEAI